MEKSLEQIAINTKYTIKELGEYINSVYPITLKLKSKPKKETQAKNIPTRRGENWTLGTYHDKNNIPKEYRTIVYDFINTLELATPKENKSDLAFLYNNYNTISIHNISFQLYDLLSIIKKITGSKTDVDEQLSQSGLMQYDGRYISEDNTILLNKNSNSLYTTLIHELMHMASYNYKDGKNGFCWKSNGWYVGHSLDEGINNYLCYKMFGSKGYIEDFSFETTIFSLLGETVGFQQTKSSFLRGEPGEFIGELAKYYPTNGREFLSAQPILNLISVVDKISSSKFDKNTPSEIYNCIYMTIKIFLTKQIYQYGSIKNTPYLNIQNFMSMIPKVISVHGNEIAIDKNGIYNNVCNELNGLFPQAGYQTIYSHDNAHQRVA